MRVEMLRGVYTERSACAQHDSAVTYSDAWTNLLICIIGPPRMYRYPDYFVKPHNHAPTDISCECPLCKG